LIQSVYDQLGLGSEYHQPGLIPVCVSSM
jgi:hypothetical protein